MKKGGYQIIDLENRNFKSAQPQEMVGIYDKIEATRKPILVSGIQFNDVEYHDAFASVIKVGSRFDLTIQDGFVISVTDTDIVAITNVAV